LLVTGVDPASEFFEDIETGSDVRQWYSGNWDVELDVGTRYEMSQLSSPKLYQKWENLLWKIEI
jgi:hypothetical protein